jgi:glutaredoxin
MIVWHVLTPGKYDDFAKCLSEKGAVMYGAEWCSRCKDQKMLFGKSFKYVTYVECPENPKLCKEKGIERYPTWIIDDVSYEGVQRLEKLGSLTGCSLV